MLCGRQPCLSDKFDRGLSPPLQHQLLNYVPCPQRQLSNKPQQQQQLLLNSTRCQSVAQDTAGNSSNPSQLATRNAYTHEPNSSSSQQPLSFKEIQQIAAARGLQISLKTLGPGYRIVCRDGDENGPVLGATAGFVAPLFGLMHCDTLQVFTRGMKGDAGDRIRRNALGLGLLLGGAVFSYGRSCGCRKAEILAINDDDAWHERLVRYYSYFGFKPVCKVGGQGFFKDVPHLLVWGGEGTRMDADIEQTLERWTPALRQSARSIKQGKTRSVDGANNSSDAS